MPITQRTPLRQSTLNRNWYLDVNVGTIAQPEWVAVNGFTEITATYVQNREKTDDNDSNGAPFSQVTGYDWGVSGMLRRGLTDAGVYDPGQEFLRLAALSSQASDIVDIRIYQVIEGLEGYGEAYRGRASSSWEPQGGGSRGVDMVRLTLEGQGERFEIPHPGL